MTRAEAREEVPCRVAVSTAPLLARAGVGLEVESVLHPERYPLVSRVHEAGFLPRKKGHGIRACVLALLQLTLHDGARAWKGFDFEVMGRLFEKGYILDPRGKAKSVVLTAEGIERSRELFVKLFGKSERS